MNIHAYTDTYFLDETDRAFWAVVKVDGEKTFSEEISAIFLATFHTDRNLWKYETGIQHGGTDRITYVKPVCQLAITQL